MQYGTRLNGRYEIMRELGSGGSASVYLANDVLLGKLWAVKVLHTNTSPDTAAGFLKEAELIKKLSHPALPRVVDLFFCNGAAVLVMDYIKGKTLREILLSEGAQEESQVQKWGIELANVLAYLHHQSIVYCDLKPSNVICTEEGSLFLVDLGAALISDFTACRYGTGAYAAPEQKSKDETVDFRADQYALGKLLLHLLAGKDCASRKRRCFAPSSGRFYRVLKKMTAYAPENRYQSDAGLIAALAKAQDGRRSLLPAKGMGILLLTILFIISGRVLPYISTILKQQNQEPFSEAFSASLPQEALLLRQIRREPKKAAPYERLLALYLQDGKLEKNEGEVLLGLSHIPTEELLFQVGQAFFILYSDQEGADFRTGVLYAERFFAGCKIDQADAYVFLCRFFRQYFFQRNPLQEADLSTYGKLLGSISEFLLQMPGDLPSFSRLRILEQFLDLIYAERYGMLSVCLDEKKINTCISEIITAAHAVEEVSEQTAERKAKLILACRQKKEKMRQLFQTKAQP